MNIIQKQNLHNQSENFKIILYFDHESKDNFLVVYDMENEPMCRKRMPHIEFLAVKATNVIVPFMQTYHDNKSMVEGLVSDYFFQTY